MSIDIVVGIVSAVLGGWLAGLLGIAFGGILGTYPNERDFPVPRLRRKPRVGIVVP
ncbi:hypothetical protein [Burkholderia cenocepacia]|uniref:hypothetical protein n=1 Tax=Burkholderia cenocepacia TaxID=95486 RepID=UPI003C12F8CA